MRTALKKLMMMPGIITQLETLPKYTIIRVATKGKFTSAQGVQMHSMVQQVPVAGFASKIINVPSMGDSITEGEVKELLKKVGDYVDLDEIVCSVETDKTQVPIRSPEAGVITELFAAEGQGVEVGKPFFVIDTEGKKPAASSKPAAADAKKGDSKAAPGGEAKATGSASKGETQAPLVGKKDPKGSAQKPATQMEIQWGEKNRTEKREPLSRMRQRIGERLKDSQNTYALLTTFQEVDMGTAMELRNKFQTDFQKKHNVKLGFMSFFIKAATAALQHQPIVNAVIDGKEIVYRNYVDISVAVATPTGLMVPVLRNTENMSFATVEKELIRLGNKGKEGSISVEDMAGGTFTISNGGVFGSLFGTPILNPPQSAILGMHSIVNRPVVKNDQIVARPMMYLALTYDHRLVDGREAVTFLKAIKDEIEDPRRLLLDL